MRGPDLKNGIIASQEVRTQSGAAGAARWSAQVAQVRGWQEVTLCNIWAGSRWKVRALHTGLAVADLACVGLSLGLRRGTDILPREWSKAYLFGGGQHEATIRGKWIRYYYLGDTACPARSYSHHYTGQMSPLTRGHTPGLRIEATISIIFIIAEPKLWLDHLDSWHSLPGLCVPS